MFARTTSNKETKNSRSDKSTIRPALALGSSEEANPPPATRKGTGPERSPDLAVFFPASLFRPQMNRSGIFQIAFDHDRYGNKSEVKQEPSATQGEEEEEEDDDDTERWIHEQRLQIDHPDFFCGQGDNPPVGIDNCRPRGAWFLHRSPPVQRQQGQEQEQAQAQGQGQEQEQPALDPASPPAACSRTPHNLSNGGGGQGSSTTTSSSARSSSGGDSSSSSSSGSSSSTSSSPALPQSHVVCGPVSLGNDGGDLGGGSGSGSSVAAAAQANANATDSVGEERDAGGLMGVGLPYAFA